MNLQTQSTRGDRAAADNGLLDDALDTLGYLLLAFGRDAFRTDEEPDAAVFGALCEQVVCHVENGAPVDALGIEMQASGARDWPAVRRFFAARRKSEREFVERTMGDYRGAVEDLFLGLRDLCDSGHATEETVSGSLRAIHTIVEGGHVPDIKRALADTITTISDAFVEQKARYESQINSLQSRLSGLREDLLVAREKLNHDPLTGLYNRRAFDVSIERFLNLHYMLDQPFSLVMIDIDNFKAINDSLGHAAGDRLLKAVADRMARAFVRKNDLTCRFGGDEFAVILPETTAEQSRVSIERFLDGVRGLELENWPGDGKISCSAGCAEVDDGDSVESLVGRADRALYDAKQAGRNCLRIR
ncbi:MAG: GGDEF domain-containing protein [Woeseiaceae bacterium]|nr:GGDEF domain-containing protein [Woeseiaceae bacterium]